MTSKEGHALGFDKVPEEEKAEILKSRQRSGLETPTDKNLWRPRGLAFSGGGIRSATFCLGVLQAICVKKQLNSYDYLSTVSGGGYIGAFLTTWIQRKDDYPSMEPGLPPRHPMDVPPEISRSMDQRHHRVRKTRPPVASIRAAGTVARENRTV